MRTFGSRLVVLTVAALAVSAAPASAYTAAPGWIASDYVTGFATPGGTNEAGPLGLAFDSAGNLFVTDISAGTLHKVPPGGGTAEGSQIQSGLGKPAGLAFGLDGKLYMGRADQARIDEVSPANGNVVRTVVSGLSCPTGLATDPLSGDLFASNKCNGGTTVRVSNPSGSKPSARTYTAQRDDGLTFAPDGTLFAAADDQRVDRIDGTNSSTPGQASTVANVSEIDGIAYAPATSSRDAYIVVNRNSGEVDKLDNAGNLTPVVTGASRGDLVTVGPDHCVYAALQDRVIRIAPSSGSCEFAPPAGQGVLGSRQTSPVVDLLVKGSAPKRARHNSRFSYTLKVLNRGPGGAHKVVLTDKLAKGLRFVSARPSAKGVACRRKGRTVTCRRNSLAKGKSFKVKLVVRAVHGKKYVNNARVSSKDLDRAPGNNRARQTTRIKHG
jgi:uncharacterized repeat protein (TIGR01451 family)